MPQPVLEIICLAKKDPQNRQKATLLTLITLKKSTAVFAKHYFIAQQSGTITFNM